MTISLCDNCDEHPGVHRGVALGGWEGMFCCWCVPFPHPPAECDDYIDYMESRMPFGPRRAAKLRKSMEESARKKRALVKHLRNVHKVADAESWQGFTVLNETHCLQHPGEPWKATIEL